MGAARAFGESTGDAGGIDWEVLQDAPRAVMPADGEFVQTVVAAVAAGTGTPPAVTCCPGVLEIRVYDRLGIPAVAVGPGLIDKMHGRDEDVRSGTSSRWPRSTPR
jgi:acetylornithine deacetylase/succinyl-diaminopimelate desuccinylase-like protein